MRENSNNQIKSFTILRTYYDAYQKMSSKERLEYMGAIFSYAFEGTEPKFSEPMADMAFTLVRPTLEKSVHYHTKQMENGTKGGRPKKTKPENPNETQKKRESDSESDSEYESDNESESKYDLSLSAEKAPWSAPQARRITDETDELSAFEKLWRSYPRKGDRKKAYGAFLNTGLPGDLLVKAFEDQKQAFAHRQNRQFIPTLAAWLELEMYRDISCIDGSAEKNRPAERISLNQVVSKLRQQTIKKPERKFYAPAG